MIREIQNMDSKNRREKEFLKILHSRACPWQAYWQIFLDSGKS
jgi:hypothetical protein